MRVSTILGSQFFALGADAAAWGDLDDDGFDDLVYGSPAASIPGRVRPGELFVLFGRPGSWPQHIDTRPGQLPSPDRIRITHVLGANGSANPNGFGDILGYSLASGDLDGDGRTDILANEMMGDGVATGSEDVGNLILLDGDLVVPPPLVD